LTHQEINMYKEIIPKSMATRQTILNYQLLKEKIRNIKTFKDFRKLPEGIGPLEVIMTGDAIMFRIEFNLRDPWLVIDEDGAKIWETREGYERKDYSEVLE